MNAGQMCWAGSRLIVHEDVHDELVEAIVAEISKWPVGPGMEDGVRMGSMVHTSHRDDVLDMLSKGLEQGGEIACGGNALDRDGAFMKIPKHTAFAQYFKLASGNTTFAPLPPSSRVTGVRFSLAFAMTA